MLAVIVVRSWEKRFIKIKRISIVKSLAEINERLITSTKFFVFFFFFDSLFEKYIWLFKWVQMNFLQIKWGFNYTNEILSFSL